MKALRINPDLQIVEEVHDDFNDFRKIQEAIGCDCFTIAGTLNGHTVFVDDEGLFKLNLMFTKMSHYHTPLAGQILVLGMDADGDSQDAEMTVEELEEEIGFLSLAEVQAMYGKAS